MRTAAPTREAPRIQFSRRLRAVGRVGDVAVKLGLVKKPTELSLFEERVRRATGLDDFGAGSWRESLQLLLSDCHAQGLLNFLGSMRLSVELTRVLENRLRIEAMAKRYPEAGKAPVAKPLIIVGLPRTGSTLLHNLLCLHPEARVPYHWMLMRPAAPLDAEDRRRVLAEQSLARSQKAIPGMDAIHPIRADWPDECLWLCAQTGLTEAHLVSFDVPRYVEHFLASDHREAMAYHRRQLQVMQWQQPGQHWVLKAPGHMFRMRALLEVYPDARIVHTHRDPLSVLPSQTSLAEMASGSAPGPLDLGKLGEQSADLWWTGIDRMLDAREQLPPEQVVDVHFDELMDDPARVVAGIYEHFGMPVPEDSRARVEGFIAEQPRNKAGVHRYTLERYGLTPDGVRKRYARYFDFVSQLRAKAPRAHSD